MAAVLEFTSGVMGVVVGGGTGFVAATGGLEDLSPGIASLLALAVGDKQPKSQSLTVQESFDEILHSLHLVQTMK
jgi:hypothetical protein